MGLISRVSSRTYREKHSMAYFNQGNYEAYYKPKAPPGGQSSIFLGGDDKPAEQPKLKPEETKVEETKVETKPVVETQPETEPQAQSETAEKENSRPGSSAGSDNPVDSSRPEPIKPKANDIFKTTEYPDGQQQGTQPQSKKNVGYRVINPPGGKSSGPLW